MLITTLTLAKIFSEASISNKHNYKTFSKSPPASLLHICVENILNHSSGKCCDSLTIAALSFIKSTGFVQYLFANISIATASLSVRNKDDTDTSLSFSSRGSLWYSKRLCLPGN